MSAQIDPEVVSAIEEIQRLLEAPLVELVDTKEERAAAEHLNREALEVPAMARLRDLVAFVGPGRPGTQSGNLKPTQAMAAVAALGLGDASAGEIRSMDDLPELAHVFHWAAAAGFVAKRGTKVVAGPRALDLERDPLSAWLTAATTLLDYGLLDGFRRGWRKAYVELLDAEAGDQLAAMFEAGGAAPLAAIEHGAWEHVVLGYDLDIADDDERRHVIRLVGSMVTQLADVGIVRCHDGVVSLTGWEAFSPWPPRWRARTTEVLQSSCSASVQSAPDVVVAMRPGWRAPLRSSRARAAS
jgi:hypothetical protein